MLCLVGKEAHKIREYVGQKIQMFLNIVRSNKIMYLSQATR